jgi:hypothetical protein
MELEFGYLRTSLELTGGNLSQNLATLENAGPITISKGYEGNDQSRGVSLTKAGQTALRVEILTLSD